MRLLPAVLLASSASCSAFGQTCAYKTFAGAMPPNLRGTSAGGRRLGGVALEFVAIMISARRSDSSKSFEARRGD